MAARGRKKASSKSIESLTHEEARRTNLPSAEHQSLMRDEEQKPFRLAYERRNRDLDPQLVWRGKDQQDQSDLHPRPGHRMPRPLSHTPSRDCGRPCVDLLRDNGGVWRRTTREHHPLAPSLYSG